MLPDTEHAYPRTGEVLEGKYAIERLIGEGAMGAVFQATHLLRQAPVALKFMSPAIIDVPGVVERFLNEGVAASRINNEHVVHVLDVSKLPSGVPYLVMEYLEGENLEQLLIREGEPGLRDVGRAVFFVLQVLRALQVAHRSGIVHRDLKPANCFVVRKDDDPDFIKILDFGISKVTPVGQPSNTQLGPGSVSPLNLTGVGAALGTPLYVSPEQARNPKNVDARSDLYSVAVMLYELLTGRTPFEPESGTLSELFMMLATMTPLPVQQLRDDLPPGLSELVDRGLEKAPENRFQSAAEMAEALAPFADRRSDYVLRQLLQRPSQLARRPSTIPPAGVPAMAREAGGATQQWGSEPAPNAGGHASVAPSRAPARNGPGGVSNAPAANAAAPRATTSGPGQALSGHPGVGSAAPAAAARVSAGTAPGVGSETHEARGSSESSTRGRGWWWGLGAAAIAGIGGLLLVLPERAPTSRMGLPGAGAVGSAASAPTSTVSGSAPDPAREATRAKGLAPRGGDSAAALTGAREQVADAGVAAVGAPSSEKAATPGKTTDSAPGTPGKGAPSSAENKTPSAPGKLRLRDIGGGR